MDKAEKLIEEPFPKEVKRVVGVKEKAFRVRLGDYRILYTVLRDKNLVFVIDIDKRGRVYS